MSHDRVGVGLHYKNVERRNEAKRVPRQDYKPLLKRLQQQSTRRGLGTQNRQEQPNQADD